MNVCYYKPGDYIYKMTKSKIYKPLQLYKILKIEEKVDGNFYDGYTITYIATILSQDSKSSYDDTEEYFIQYRHDSHNINTRYALIATDPYIFNKD